MKIIDDILSNFRENLNKKRDKRDKKLRVFNDDIIINWIFKIMLNFNEKLEI